MTSWKLRKSHVISIELSPKTVYGKRVLAMFLKDLEIAVLSKFLEKHPSFCCPVELEKIRVVERNQEGSGFYTELNSDDAPRDSKSVKSFHWGEIGAKLNDNEIESDFVFFVKDGILDAVEGATFGEEYPLIINKFTVYDVKICYGPNRLAELAEESDT